MAHTNIKLTLLLVSLFITVVISFKLNGRIVGGRDSEKGRFPYYVGLFNYETTKHICGGAIISEWHILTAAHCVAPFKQRPDLIGVAYGTINLGVDRAFNHVKNITIPSNFEWEAMRDDIAILRTTDKIKFTKYIQPIAVAKSNFADANGIEAILCGFGLTNITSQGQDHREVEAKVLQYIKVNTLSKSQCIQKYKESNYEHEDEAESIKRALNGKIFCTAHEIGSGPCYGDSGSPLAVNGKLVGIASASVKCALGYPEIYTNVYEYHGWIVEEISTTK